MTIDIIVFGASGYTGQFVVEEIGRAAEETPRLTFAVAGRNHAKLEAVLCKARKSTSLPFEDIPIIIADVHDAESLVDMAKQGKIIINCVGPYRFHGEKVVAACIEAQADHIDISGEPQYLENVQLRFSQMAEDKNVHIIGSCGFDSVPADMGTLFLQRNFEGDINSVEMVVGLHDDSVGSAPINATTLECAVHGYAKRNELKTTRKQIFAGGPPRPTVKSKPRGVLTWSQEARRWCLPNLASDKSVVMRTQLLNFKRNATPAIQFEAYFGMQSLWYGIGAIGFGVMFAFMTAFGWTRNLLIKYPSIFTFGIFTHGGPKILDLEKLKFCVTLVGKGWKSGKPEDEAINPPETSVVAQITGPDPGYFSTALIVTQCALVILQERNKLPGTGGVHTPGAAFLNTSLIERLQKKGISFEMVQ